MNKDSDTFFDAVFISPYKFVGGPGSSGILVFNERIYDQTISPSTAGGGTVDFVSNTIVDYSEDIEVREHAGTPGVLQTIKAALAVDLKNAIGIENIASKEREYTTRALERLSKHPRIKVLGPLDPKNRISIVSFEIIHGNKKLHPKFVTKLLNDLFGIQSRAGCMCAGPYGHSLIQISEEKSQQISKITRRGWGGIKPGWCRINFHYLFSEEEFQFVCQSIEFIADNGYRFLKDYSFNINTGEWVHIDFKDVYLSSKPVIKTLLSTNLEDCFDEEHIDQKKEFTKYLKSAKDLVHTIREEEDYLQFDDPEVEELRFFKFSHINED